MVSEVLCVTAQAAKFLLESSQFLAHIDCFDEFQVPLHLAARFVHTGPQCSSLAVRNLRTANDERCEALATRLRVGLFSSRIQLSLLPHWPHLAKKGSTVEATTRVNSVAPVS